jgi:hypothetical protein
MQYTAATLVQQNRTWRCELDDRECGSQSHIAIGGAVGRVLQRVHAAECSMLDRRAGQIRRLAHFVATPWDRYLSVSKARNTRQDRRRTPQPPSATASCVWCTTQMSVLSLVMFTQTALALFHMSSLQSIEKC